MPPPLPDKPNHPLLEMVDLERQGLNAFRAVFDAHFAEMLQAPTLPPTSP
jgi:hypothetical protein